MSCFPYFYVLATQLAGLGGKVNYGVNDSVLITNAHKARSDSSLLIFYALQQPGTSSKGQVSGANVARVGAWLHTAC